MKCGIVAEKVGMTRIFTDDGTHVPVTVLCLKDIVVFSCKLKEKDGYDAIVLAHSGKVLPRKLNKPQLGAYIKNNCEPRASLSEFKVDKADFLDVGTEIRASYFSVGEVVDIQGVSIGKGFAGVMKRHNFAGLEASHGVSVSHRSHGSTGQRQDPGKVFKGKKMAGHMGHSKVTVKSLKIIKIDEERNLLFIKGSVPGHAGGKVRVCFSKKNSF